MLIGKPAAIASSEITPESIYWRRRDFLQAAAALGSLPLLGGTLAMAGELPALRYRAVDPASRQGFYTAESPTPYADVTRYNNFYEFGMDKDDPAKYAGALQTEPWSVSVEGAVARPGTYTLEDILAQVDIEERIYRLRCVEAWSMVVPWVGFSLASLLARFEPNSDARFVQFVTLQRPAQMPGQRSHTGYIDWPYLEGLRMDEAMHPLSFIAIGLYGRELPPQNGAPLRLVVPWKYGFKSIKSIVKIRFVSAQPATTWQSLAPQEYGFYANVNPQVDHPRWSQKTERRLPSSLFSPNRRPTQLFNGYADQVAGLYRGMDLRRFY